MAFTTLAELYEKNVNKLYKLDSAEFNTGEPLYLNRLTAGPMSDEIKYDSRSLPITSTLRDIKRFTKFTLSPKGILSLAQQQLLQTGNSFSETALINPAFIISNTVPFLHIARNLSAVSFFKSPDTIRGRLHKTTGRIAAATAKGNRGNGSKQRAVRGEDAGIISGLINEIKGTVSNVAGALNPRSVVYEENDRPDIKHFDELKRDNKIPSFVADGKLKDLTYEVAKQTANRSKNAPKTSAVYIGPDATVDINLVDRLAEDPSTSRRPDINNFDTLVKALPAEEVFVSIARSTGFLGTATGTTKGSIQAITKLIQQNFGTYDPNYNITKKVTSYKSYQDLVRSSYSIQPNVITGKKELSYYNDREFGAVPENSLPKKSVGQSYTPEQEQTIYDFKQKTPKDFIDIFINVPSKSKSVKFRSFIKGLKTTAKPEYSSTRYIGRTEKYITYSGTSRTVSFELTLVAFSQDEIDGMYARLNYLQGLTFPLGATQNINSKLDAQLLQPPMVTLTIGNVFVNQPGYFDNISIMFSDTYDIDKGLPMFATVSISYIIIEKEVMFYNYPNIGEFDGNNTSTQPTPTNISPNETVINTPTGPLPQNNTFL